MNAALNSVIINIEPAVEAGKLKYTVNGVEVTGDVFAKPGDRVNWECDAQFTLDITYFIEKPAAFPKAPPKGQQTSPFPGNGHYPSDPPVGGRHGWGDTVNNNTGFYKYSVNVPTWRRSDDPLIIVE